MIAKVYKVIHYASSFLFPYLVFGIMSFDGGEANVVFLNDGWIQTVEIQQDNVLVVKALLRFQHETTTVGRFSSFGTLRFRF
jgi:hypothetical protein